MTMHDNHKRRKTKKDKNKLLASPSLDKSVSSPSQQQQTQSSPDKTAEESSSSLITYDEWKQSCNVSIRHYLNQRYDNNTPNGNKNRNQADKESNGGVLHPSTDSSNTRSIVPPISQLTRAATTVTTIPQINLQTYQIDHLPLLEIIHVDPIRCWATRKSLFPQRKSQEQQQKCVLSFPFLQQYPTKDNDENDCNNAGTTNSTIVVDDGPLFPLYKRVLSVEVVQRDVDEDDEMSSKPQNCTCTPSLKLYFYNEYATALNDMLHDDENNNKQVFIALSNIPACCIFPWSSASPGVSTAAATIHPFCIAIGGPSKACLQDSRLSFDSPAFHMVVVRLKDNDTTRKSSYASAQYPNPQQEDDDDAPKERINPEEELYQRVIQWKKNRQQQQSLSEVVVISDESSLPSSQKKRSAPNEGTSTRSKRATTDNNSRRKRPKVTSLSTAAVVHTDDSMSTAAMEDDIQIEGYKQLSAIQDVCTQQLHQPQQKRAFARRRHRKRRPNNDTIHVIGVIMAFAPPSRTNKNSWTMSVEIQDPTHIVKVTISRSKRTELPTIPQVGDLMVLEEAGIHSSATTNHDPNHSTTIQLLGRSTTKIKVISILSNNLHNDDDGCNYSTSQWKAMMRLWKWGQHYFANPTIQTTTIDDGNTATFVQPMTLQDLPVPSSSSSAAVHPGDADDNYNDEGRELTAMICAILPSNTNAFIGPMGYLRLWDGTGEPIPDSVPATIASGKTPSDDLSTEAWKKLEETIVILNNDTTTNNNTQGAILEQSVTALTGRVVNVAVWELPHWDYIQCHCSVGMFIRLRNVQQQQQQTIRSDDLQVALQIHAKTWIYALPPQTLEIRQLLENHERRIRNPQQNNNKNAPFTSDDAFITTTMVDKNPTSEPSSLETLRTERDQYRSLVQKLKVQLHNSQEDSNNQHSSTAKDKYDVARQLRVELETCKKESKQLIQNLKRDKQTLQKALDSQKKEAGDDSSLSSLRKERNLYYTKTNELTCLLEKTKAAARYKEERHEEELKHFQNLIVNLERENRDLRQGLLPSAGSSNTAGADSFDATLDTVNNASSRSLPNLKPPVANAELKGISNQTNDEFNVQNEVEESTYSRQTTSRDHNSGDDGPGGIIDNEIMVDRHSPEKSADGGPVSLNDSISTTESSEKEEISPLEMTQNSISSPSSHSHVLEDDNVNKNDRLISRGMNMSATDNKNQKDIQNDDDNNTIKHGNTDDNISNTDDEGDVHYNGEEQEDDNHDSYEQLPRSHDIILGYGGGKYCKHQGNIWYYERTEALLDEWLKPQTNNGKRRGGVRKVTLEQNRIANKIIKEATEAGGSFLRYDKNKNLYKLQNRIGILNEVTSRMFRLSCLRNKSEPIMRKKKSCRMKDTSLSEEKATIDEWSRTTAVSSRLLDETESKDNITSSHSIGVESPRVVNEQMDLPCKSPTSRNDDHDKTYGTCSKSNYTSCTDQQSATNSTTDTPMDDESRASSEDVSCGDDINNCLPESDLTIESLIRKNSALIAAKTNELMQHDGVVPATNEFSSSNSPVSYHPPVTSLPNLTFPQKIFSLLSVNEYQNALYWLLNGDGFVINPPFFTANILPNFFGELISFESFIQQLSYWGFEKISSKFFIYSHPLFRRDYPQLCGAIRYTHREQTNSIHQQAQLQNLLFQRHLAAAGGFQNDASFGCTTNGFQHERFGANRPFINHIFPNGSSKCTPIGRGGLNSALINTAANILPRNCQPSCTNEEEKVVV